MCQQCLNMMFAVFLNYALLIIFYSYTTCVISHENISGQFVSSQRLTILTKKQNRSLMSVTFEPWHYISNHVVCATNKASDQPAHTRRLIRAFTSRLNSL